MEKNKMNNGVVLKRICLRCGHVWVQRSESMPVSCPGCHSPYWNRKRRKDLNA